MICTFTPRRWIVLACSILCVLGRSAAASDGVVDINHIRALQGYVTETDSEGYPVVLDRAGSYRLTSNLDVGVHIQAQNRSGIEITASHVTLDLNGFEIRGVTECSGEPPATPVTCSFSGSGIGIDTTADADNIVIYNGTVRAMGARGIYLRRSGRVQNVAVIGNGTNGIEVAGTGAILRGNRAEMNGNRGLVAGAGALLRDNVAVRNNNAGAFLGDGSVVSGNSFEWNRTVGAFLGSGSVARSNVARGNISIGLAAGTGSLILHNTTTGGSSSGISVFPGSAVTGCTVTDNLGSALSFTNGNSAYGQNVIIRNNGGGETQADGGGIQIGTNFCGSNTTCP